MSQETHAPYEFLDLPIDPVRPGTSLLVAGPPLSGTKELTLRLLTVGDHSDGAIFLSVDDNGLDLVSSYESAGGTFDRSCMAVVNCEAAGDTDDSNVRNVRGPDDLTGIGIEFSSLYEQLHREGINRVRTGLFSISTLLLYADEIQPVYRFLHTLTGRVRSADGFAACIIDPTAVDEQTLSSIAQTFDGRIDIRETDDQPELRVRGLPDQPSDWQPFIRL